MSNSEDQARLRARIEALEAMVIVLAQHLSAVPASKRAIDGLIEREVQSFRDNEDELGASAMLALQDDLEAALLP